MILLIFDTVNVILLKRSGQIGSIFINQRGITASQFLSTLPRIKTALQRKHFDMDIWCSLLGKHAQMLILWLMIRHAFLVHSSRCVLPLEIPIQSRNIFTSTFIFKKE